MSATIDPRLIQAIDRAIAERGWNGRLRGGEAYFSCPAHDDATPSASWNPEKHVWSCHIATCGASGGAIDLARRLGLDLPARPLTAGPTPFQSPRRVVSTFTYQAADGRPLYAVDRVEPGRDGSRKDYLPRLPHVAPGAWAHYGIGDTARVLYGLPSVLTAPPDAVILIVEGEKCADALRAWGYIATCNLGGAGKFRPTDAEALRGKRVCLVPDNDEAGRRHADTVGALCRGVAAEIRELRLPHLPPKGDIVDAITAGLTREQFDALLAQAPPWIPPADADLRARLAELEAHGAAPAPSAGQPGACPLCRRDRRNVIELAQFKGAAVRAVRNTKMRPAERLILIEEALGIEQHQRATGTDGPAYRPHTAIAASLGISRATVKEVRERWNAAGAIVVTQGPPPADLVAGGKTKEYDGTCVAPPPPVDGRDATLTLAARTINTVIRRVAPKPHGNLGKPRPVKVAAVLPDTFEACAACPPETPVQVTVNCTGCGEILYQDQAITTAAGQTVRKNGALLYKETEQPSLEETVRKNGARFVTATPTRDVARRRQTLRGLAPVVVEHRERPRCQATGCDAVTDGVPYCPECIALGWGQVDATAAPVEPPPPAPPCAWPGCARPAEYRTPAGDHCRLHALWAPGGLSTPLPPVEVSHAAD